MKNPVPLKSWAWQAYESNRMREGKHVINKQAIAERLAAQEGERQVEGMTDVRGFPIHPEFAYAWSFTTSLGWGWYIIHSGAGKVVQRKDAGKKSAQARLMQCSEDMGGDMCAWGCDILSGKVTAPAT